MRFEKDTKEIIKMSVLLIFLILAGFGLLFPKSSKVKASGNPALENGRIIREGVAASRKKGGFGESCASCHSPDLIELAVYDFGDDTLRRRANSHVSTKDREKMVAMIHALRDKYQKLDNFDADYGSFADKGNSLESKTPMSQQHRLLYQNFVANSYRMSLFLLEVENRQKSGREAKSKLNIKEVKKFLGDAENERDLQNLLSLKNYK